MVVMARGPPVAVGVAWWLEVALGAGLAPWNGGNAVGAMFDAERLVIEIPAVELPLRKNEDGSYTSAYMQGNAELRRAVRSTVTKWAAEVAREVAAQVETERRTPTSQVAALQEQVAATQRLLLRLLEKVEG